MKDDAVHRIIEISKLNAFNRNATWETIFVLDMLLYIFYNEIKAFNDFYSTTQFNTKTHISASKLT